MAEYFTRQKNNNNNINYNDKIEGEPTLGIDHTPSKGLPEYPVNTCNWWKYEKLTGIEGIESKRGQIRISMMIGKSTSECKTTLIPFLFYRRWIPSLPFWRKYKDENIFVLKLYKVSTSFQFILFLRKKWTIQLWFCSFPLG